MHLNITYDKQIARFGNMLSVLSGKEQQQAIGRALNRTAFTVRSQVGRKIAQTSGIPVKIAKAQLMVRQASTGHAGTGAVARSEAQIVARGKPLSLKHFRAKQFTRGVRAKIDGRFEMFDGYFIDAGKLGSGVQVANGHVFANTGLYSAKSGRDNALEKQHDASVPGEFAADYAQTLADEIIATELPKRLSHEIGRLLPGE